jgi:hypothetical protein
MATEGHLTPSEFPLSVRNRKLRNIVVTEGHVNPSEVSLGCSLRRPRPIFSMVTGTSHPRLIFSMVTGTKHPRPIFSVVTGTSPDYLPLLFSYSVYIGCVVLQGCLRSHCGTSKSQMVNLIPTCIVSSKKNYFRMILLNSEKNNVLEVVQHP